MLLFFLFIGFALGTMYFRIGAANGWPIWMAIGVAFVPVLLVLFMGILGIIVTALGLSAMYKAYG